MAIDTPVVAQRQIPMVRFPEILHLQYIDKLVVMGVQVLQFVRCFGRQSRSHSCSSFIGPGR